MKFSELKPGEWFLFGDKAPCLKFWCTLRNGENKSVSFGYARVHENKLIFGVDEFEVQKKFLFVDVGSSFVRMQNAAAMESGQAFYPYNNENTAIVVARQRAIIIDSGELLTLQGGPFQAYNYTLTETH